MAFKVRKKNEQQEEERSFGWDELDEGEGVYDPAEGIFLRTDEGWVNFDPSGDGNVVVFDNEARWLGTKVRIVEVVYE